MKEKLKQTKGITLIALIITIIILLILAVVSIRLVINNGIISKAEKGVDEYAKAEQDEQEQLLKAEYEMAKYEGKYSGTFTDYVLETKYNGVQIGDYVNYNELSNGTQTHTPDTSKGAGTSRTGGSSSTGYTLETSEVTTEDLNWRVLGVNSKGQLELISDNPMHGYLYLVNEEGYLNAEYNLNTFCNELYGKGQYAESARSLKAEDINTLANYDPTTYSGYGVEWWYRYPTQNEMDEYTGSSNSTRYMQYSKDGGITWENIVEDDYQKFKIPGGNTIGKINDEEIKEGREKLANTYYSYTVSDKIADENILNMITKGTGTSSITQWLASRSEATLIKGTQFNVMRLTAEEKIYYGLFFLSFGYYGYRRILCSSSCNFII